MAAHERTIEIYVRHLRGKIIVIHGSSPKELAVAKRLTDSLTAHGTRATEYLAVNARELGYVVATASHIVLVFNLMENLAKKLRHNEEFTAHISKMRLNDLVVVCKATQISKLSPLVHFMQFSFDEDAHNLAVKCLTIFGAPKPIAGDTDAVLWHDQPTRVILKRQDNSSLGLSIITRQLHPVQSPLKRVTLIKDINQGGTQTTHPLLKKYMHIQSINGVSLDNRDVSEAAGIMQDTGDIEVQLMVRSSRRDIEKAERLRRQHGDQYAESPVELQREQFTLAPKHPAEKVGPKLRMSTRSGDFGSSVSSQGSGDMPAEDVFKQEHKKPTDLRCVTNNCITGVRQRGDTFDEFRWEKDMKYDMLIGGEGTLGLSLTLVDFAVNEEYSQGVMIKDFRSGCHSTNRQLQVNDLIHTIEGTSLIDMPINKVIEVLEHSRGRNTEVTIGFHHMINMNLEINQSRVRRLLPQRYIGRSDEGVCVEKQPFLPATGNHYHNVLVLGDSTYTKEIMGILCNGVKSTTTIDLSDSKSLLIQRYLDDGWEPVEEKADGDSLSSADCEYVVTMLDHNIVDMQFPPMNLLQHIFLKPSGVTILVVALDSYYDDPFSEYAKLQSTVSLINAHACPKGTHVIVVGVYHNITEKEATEVAQAITDVVKKSPALNNLIVDCDRSSIVFMYKSQSEDHRSIKSQLQLMVKNCINAYYKRLEHHSQHYIPKQWPIVRRQILQMSTERPIIPLKDLDEPIKGHCSMESNGHPYINLLKILQEYSPALFFASGEDEPQRDLLCDPSVIPRMFAQILPTAIEKHSKFNKNDLELFTSSLIISSHQVRLVMMEEMKDKEEMKEFPFEALLEWMINLLLAFRITIDSRAGAEAAVVQPSKSECEYIFFPLLGQFTSKPILPKDLYKEFQTDTWKLYVYIKEPISAAFYYKFLTLLIQRAFECHTPAERVNCFRISSHGQLATVCFHAENNPMYFKLMVEFHELQRVIEIRMKKQMHFQFSRFSGFIEGILQELCAMPHWMHLKHSIMMGHKPSSNEDVFKQIFKRLGSLCKHDVSEPEVYQIEMSLVFGHKESYNLTTPQSDSIVAVEEAKHYTHGKKMDYPTFKVVSEILDSSGKWDLFADSLKLAGVFELSRMQRRYSMVSQGIEILSRALNQCSMEDITSALKQLELNLAVDIIEKRANPHDF